MEDDHDVYEDIQEGLLRGEQTIRRNAKWFYEDFTAFLGRDNVLEVALGLIIGASFSNVVTSLVSDIILPPITLLSPDSGNLASFFWVLRRGETPDAVYNTVQQAAADGAVYLAYGIFIQKCLDFIILGLSLYFLIQLFAIAGQDAIVKRTKKCQLCRKQISEKAARCAFCTSWQPGSNRENH